MRYLIFFAFILAAPLVRAACPTNTPSNQICVQWTAPTQWSDDKPITGSITYTVYVDGKAYGNTTATQLTTGAVKNGPHTVFVTASVSPVPAGYTSTSDPSNTGNKTTKFAGSPTNGKIEAPSGGVIEQSKPK